MCSLYITRLTYSLLIESSINVNQPFHGATAERHYATRRPVDQKPATALQPPFQFHTVPTPPRTIRSPQTAESDGRRLKSPPFLKYTLPSEAAWRLRGPPVTSDQSPSAPTSAGADPVVHRCQLLAQASGPGSSATRIEPLPRALAIDDPIEAPAEFRCPISQELMEDPVTTSDGHTYERREIFRWLCQHNTSPLTGAVLPNKALTPAIALRQLIAAFKMEHPDV